MLKNEEFFKISFKLLIKYLFIYINNGLLYNYLFFQSLLFNL